MKRPLSIRSVALAALLASVAFTAGSPPPFTPGVRTLVLAHNAYPYEGKYAERLDRALSIGFPAVIEQDLVWVNGKSLEIHVTNLAADDSPTMDSFFFPRRPSRISKHSRRQ